MEKRMLSAREVETRETLIRILESTLSSLEQKERVIVKRCILRMKSEIAETDRRRKENESRKANQISKFRDEGKITPKEYGRAKKYYKNLTGADIVIAD